jgi:hypothetical protein
VLIPYVVVLNATAGQQTVGVAVGNEEVAGQQFPGFDGLACQFDLAVGRAQPHTVAGLQAQALKVVGCDLYLVSFLHIPAVNLPSLSVVP